MFLSLRLLCQSLAAITFVQASLLSSKTKHQNGSKSRYIRSPVLNATTAGSKSAVVNLTTSSNRLSISTHPLQEVKLGLSTTPPVQECGNGTVSPVVLDCTCATQQFDAGAINDAITMVQAVQKVWNETVYLPILQQYMGLGNDYTSCQTPQALSWIAGKFSQGMAGCKRSQRTETLENLAKIQEYQWLPYDPNWLSNSWGDLSELFAYCATGVPPSQPDFTATCYQDGAFGWVYTMDGTQVCLPPKNNSFFTEIEANFS